MPKKLAYLFLCLSTLLFIAIFIECVGKTGSEGPIVLVAASLILGSSLISLAVTSSNSNKDTA